ncbi:MAG: prepilin-type N-terminal cleavage/methylation domain-containing protein [Oscillospiraceae bacterium]|nr:prepilin-type N-terminal cleavage/methylation domain-containing protein [Oscillospiraceae bacterium]
MKKRVHKGFTLLELIIVMALFSLVMYSVAKLIAPVSKFFVRSSNYESTTACVDNMKRAIEGNLKYADRVRCYSDFAPCTAVSHSTDPAEYTASPALIEQVNMFWTDYFMNRQYIDYKGKIYVMAFDNTVYQPTLSGYGTFHDFTDAQLNAGQIQLFEFNFAKTDGLVATEPPVLNTGNNYYPYFSASNKGTGADETHGQYTVTPWYVNQKMYGNYEYQFSLGNMAVAEGAAFDPSNCTINIEAYELQKADDGSGLVLKDVPHRSTASFSMKNVLDATTKYTQPLFDHKTLLNTHPGAEAYEKVITDPTPISRYSTIVNNTGAAWHTSATQSITGSTNAADLRPGFYFIFTVPETVYSVTASDGTYYTEFQTYISAVDAKYPKAS